MVGFFIAFRFSIYYLNRTVHWPWILGGLVVRELWIQIDFVTSKFFSFKIEEICTLTTFVEQSVSRNLEISCQCRWIGRGRFEIWKEVFTLKDWKQQRLRDSKLAQCLGCKRFYLFLILMWTFSPWNVTYSYRRHLLLHYDRLSLRKTWLWLPFSIKAYLIRLLYIMLLFPH